MQHLSKLLKKIEIKNITDDSRQVKKGSLFVAIKGLNSDGHAYINDAVSKGAAAVVGEIPNPNLKIPYVKVKNSRQALSLLAQSWHGNPAQKMKIIGITGTDGKTTTASMVYHILRQSGINAAMITTVEARVGSKKVSTGLHVTNPEPLKLHKFLSDFAKQKVTHVVLEVTSHGIDQGRIFGIPFEVSALTNITPEHLDYHKTLGSYAATKFKLFQNSQTSVFNIDDKNGKKFADKLNKSLTYSLKSNADFTGRILSNKFIITHKGKEYWEKLNLGGEYNYYNALAAVAICTHFNIKVTDSLSALKTFKFPAGRLEKIPNTLGAQIYIDYAHTPNGVEKILKWAQAQKQGKLYCLVSAEGERDPGKRAKIGKLAAKYCDFAVLNPIDTRSQSAQEIGAQMLSGAQSSGKKNCKVILDRSQAILHLVKKLKNKDILLLLGKGHEQSNNVAGHELKWSEKQALKQALDKVQTNFHFMGIGGSGSNAAASLAVDAGFNISGCNIEETSYLDKIKNKVPNIKIGHSPDHVSENTILVVSPSILFSNSNHPEVKAAKKVITWQEFVGKYLLKNKKLIAIAGTHGKSTTTALVGEIFEDAAIDPTVLVGASVDRWHGNCRSGKGEIFIIESDEFNDNFLHYNPETIVLNNIEFDHPDYFKNYKQLENSFAKHINNLKGAKNLIINADSEGVAKLLNTHKLPKNTKIYGYTLGNPKVKIKNMLSAEILQTNQKGTDFSAKFNSEDLGKFHCPLPGEYNVANSLGAILLSKLYNLPATSVNESIKNFQGISRRMDLKYSTQNIFIYDDYAHHPTAIAKTLEALRQKHPHQKILCIVEPHSYSRTKVLLGSYKNAFVNADKVIIGPIYQARDSQKFGISEQSIVKISNHTNISSFTNSNKMFSEIRKIHKNYNVIIIMGAGNSSKWTQEIINIYKNVK